MEIVLARHGKPNLDLRKWVAPRQLTGWLRAYDMADIVPDDIPKLALLKAADAAILVSSPLRRCAQSARQLAPLREIMVDELFREAGIPYAIWGFPRLPISVWAFLFRVAWFLGYSSNSESFLSASNRARRAAERLIYLAQQHQTVFVMGHGIMTALIARHLVAKHWVGPKRPALRYWQCRVYRSPP